MKTIGLITLSILGLWSCDDDDLIVSKGAMHLSILYTVGNNALQFDTLTYKNEAGNKYSVNHLEYYLSSFSFNKSDGTTFKSNNVYYINAKKQLSPTIRIENIPFADYTSISFFIGLDSIINKTNALLPILQNINMAWPDAMGGGYHFMKMEGYFTDSSKQNGYAIHLGNSVNLIKIEIFNPISISHENETQIMKMNINEWFKNPSIYNFNIDGNYSMGSALAMLKLKQNGKDVFTFQ